MVNSQYEIRRKAFWDDALNVESGLIPPLRLDVYTYSYKNVFKFKIMGHILLIFLAVFCVTLGSMAFIAKLCKALQETSERQMFVVELFLVSIGITMLLTI